MARPPKKIAGKRRYHILDNNLDDIKMNRTVVRRAPVLRDVRSALYQEDLFPEVDLTTQPKHLQFAYALNAEAQESGLQYTLDPSVREAVDSLQHMTGKRGQKLLDVMSHPETPMSVRLKLQEFIIEPIYERFYKEDVQEKQEQEKKAEGGEQSETEEGSVGDGENQGNSQEEKSREQGHSKDAGESGAGGAGDEGTEDYFQEEYDEFEKRYQHAVSDEAVQEAVAEEVARQKREEEKMKNSGEELLRAYAEAQGVDIDDFKRYQRHRKQLEELLNPETGESIIEELRVIFRRIVTKRKKRVLAPQYPVDEGDILAYPSEAVVRTRAGEKEIDVWETTDWKEKEDSLVGDFDVTLIGDVSASMAEKSKAKDQRLAITLLLEALTEFAEDLETEEKTLHQSLRVRTECLVFGSGKETIKTLSTILTEQERTRVYKRLDNCDGSSTQDFLALENVLQNLTEEEQEKIERGTLKKIVLVMTDGHSDDALRVQNILSQMREKGVIVVGIGITRAGQSVLQTYAPEAQVVERPAELPQVLANLLEEYLKAL